MGSELTTLRAFIAARLRYRPLRVVIAASAWAPYVLALHAHVRTTGAGFLYLLAPLLGAVAFAGFFPRRPLAGVLSQLPLLVLTAIPFVTAGIDAPPVRHLVVSAVMFSAFGLALYAPVDDRP